MVGRCIHKIRRKRRMAILAILLFWFLACTVCSCSLLRWLDMGTRYVGVYLADTDLNDNTWQEPHGDVWIQSTTDTGHPSHPKKIKSGHPLLQTRAYPTSQRRESCSNCFVYNFKNIIASSVCQAPGRIQMVLLITSKPDSLATRNSIRNTWGKYSGGNKGRVRYLFLFGSGWTSGEQKQLEEEAFEFGDILQDDYRDTYYNLSIKVIGGFHYINRHCSRARYVIRTADDNYLNIPQLRDFVILNAGDLQTSVVGHCYTCVAVPKRDVSSKWFVTVNEWPHWLYPPYCVGTTLAMSFPVMQRILKATPHTPHFVLEDVYFGIVLDKLGISVLNHPGFLLTNPTQLTVSESKCLTPKGWVSMHGVDHQDMLRVYDLCQEMKTS